VEFSIDASVGGSAGVVVMLGIIGSSDAWAEG